MSGCALRRFQGTCPPERPPATAAAKELDSALERMKRMREEQNIHYFPTGQSQTSLYMEKQEPSPQKK